jgi:AraC-like DNA-binding protein
MKIPRIARISMSGTMISLATAIERLTQEDGVHATAVPRLSLVRMSKPTLPMHSLHNPAVCIIAQGRKQVLAGDQVHVYDSAKYLVVSVDVPIVGQVIDASADEPYLCVRLDLDPAVLSGLLLDMGRELAPGDADGAGPGLGLGSVTQEIGEAAERLVRLLETPEDIRLLAPLIERELLYRLLRGDQAAQLRQIAWGGSRLQQVNRAIGWIKRNFAEPFRMEAVAAEARMSPSALHQHFKSVTAMSPLQYQKQLRLQEARRLILTQAADAATAGHRVGYDSPSQFSREYARLFGAPPLRDAARMRQTPGEFAEA